MTYVFRDARHRAPEPKSNTTFRFRETDDTTRHRREADEMVAAILGEPTTATTKRLDYSQHRKEDDSVLDRVERLRAQATPKEQARHDEMVPQLREALLRLAPEAMNDLLLDSLCDQLWTHPVTHNVRLGGDDPDMPRDSAGWMALGREMIDSNPLAQRAIKMNDAELIHGLEAEALAEMHPQERISLSRENKLRERIDEVVARKLETSSTTRYWGTPDG